MQRTDSWEANLNSARHMKVLYGPNNSSLIELASHVYEAQSQSLGESDEGETD